MLLTITNTTPDATDLGWLLHKHPDRVQEFDLAFGRAHVLYPEASADRCTAALVLSVDPIALVRNHRGPASLGQYVNDRPYAASSFMSVALAQVFGTALGGRCTPRPELVDKPLDLEAAVAVLPARGGGEATIRRLFEPLGYEVAVTRHPLDERFPEWGEGPYHTVTLSARRVLSELLNHLYVLIPVLDNEKHYWVSRDEVDKLLRRGEGWLSDHPERETIVSRYLRYLKPLTRDALARLTEDDQGDPDASAESAEREEETIERPLSLNRQRLATVAAALKAEGARTVIDLGCGEGRLVRALLDDGAFDRVAGMDVSAASLERAARRLHLDRLPAARRERVELLHGSLTYRDARLTGYDAASLVEVIEHLDPSRLGALERTVFEYARPASAIVTTPNVEYNVRFELLAEGRLRHRDHRFEWTREEFRTWCESIAGRHRYKVRYLPVGDNDPDVGPPTQMAVFTKVEP